MRVLVNVAVLGDEIGNARVAPDRPVVLAEVDVGVTQLVQRLLHVLGPAQRVAHLGAAHRQQVVHGLRQGLGAAVGLLVGAGQSHLGRRFGTGHVVEDEAHAVKHQLLRRLRNDLRRRQDAEGAVDHALAQTGIDVAFG